MKNILSYLGFNKEISPRLSRLDSLSIVSRQSVLAVIVVCLTMISGNAWGTSTNTSVTISSYASTNSWANGTRYTSVTIDSHISASATYTSGSNVGKYYSSDNTWRFYQGEGGKLVLSAGSGYKITSFTITFTVKDNGVFKYYGNTLTSGTAVSGLYAGTVEIVTGASSGSTGKVFVTKIAVTYVDGSTESTYNLVTDASTLTAGDVLVFGYSTDKVAGFFYNGFMTVSSASISAGVLTSDEALEFTLGGSAGAWTFTNNSKYLRATGSGTMTIDATTTANTWGITIGSASTYYATVTNVTYSTSKIYYNTSDPRFKNYTSASGYVQIYKKASSKTCELYDADGLINDSYSGNLPTTATEYDDWTFAGIWSKRQFHMQNSTYAYASGYYYAENTNTYTNGETLYAVYYVDSYYSTYGDGNALNVNPASGSFYITSSTAPNYLKVRDGTTVTLTATGFTPHDWTIKEHESKDAVSYTTPSSTTAQFTMPNVEVDVVACADLSGETPEFETDNLEATSTDMMWSCDYATYYLLQVKNPSNEVVYDQTTTSTWDRDSWSLTGLSPKTTYSVRIYGVNACKETSDYISSALNTTFTTKGWVVVYDKNGGTGAEPTDSNEYGASGSVEVASKGTLSKDGYYFAGWTSSEDDEVYQPGDTYTINEDVIFSAQWVACSSSNTPQNITITNDNSKAVTVSWDAVAGATRYRFEVLGVANEDYYEEFVTSTSKTVTAALSLSADDYLVTITPYNGSAICGCSADDDFTLTDGCANYSFHYGSTRGTKSITDETIECFSRVGETNEFQVVGFTIPTTSDSYFVGYQDYWYDDGMGTGTCSPSKPGSSLNYFYYLPITHLQTGCDGKTGANLPHAYAGAYGTIRIYQNSCDANLYAGFKPQGYQMRYGTSGGSDWANFELTVDPSDETVWTSDVMDVDATLKEKKYYVNVWTGSAYSSSDEGAHINNWTNGDNKITSMRHKTNSGENCADGVAAGSRGFFRMWANNCANNGYMHFVPTHRIIYHANYPVGDSPDDTYSVDVSVEETNSSISLNSAPSAPTGYTFDGWYDAASGGTKKTGSQTISAGASADVELYAHWTINTHSVNYSAPSNGDYTISVAGGAATSATKDADYGQTITLAATPNTGYEFTSWTVTGETSGDEITVSNNQFTMPDEDVTVEATFTAIDYNVTYSAPSNGNYTIKVASGTASSATKTANYGQTITLAATPSGGYDFSSWTITNTSTSADVTSSVSLSSSSTSPATFTMQAYGVTVTAAFGVQTYTITYKDQGGGDFTGTQTDAPTTHTYGTATTLKIPTKIGYSFGGWFTTSGCTAGSEVGNTTSASLGATAFTANITLYAKWSVNSYNVAVANVDHVAITATPASEEAIGEGSNRDVNYGKSVTLAYSSLESKNYWGGWKVTNAGGDDVTASVVDGNTLTVPDYAVTVSAVTYGNLVAWCDPQVTVSDGFCLTSYFVSGEASTKNSVYTTLAAGNLLTINSTDLGSVDKIEFCYLDGSDNTVTLTSSPFRLCNDGSSNYNVADGGAGSSYTKNGLSNTCALSYSIRYKPTDYNLMDNYKLKMVFKKGSEVRKTIIREMNGRSLPEEFVIAVKGGDQWYALPNTLKGTQGEQGAIVPVKITVDNPSGTPTQATYAPDIAIYKGRAKYAAANWSSMALTSTGSNYLQTSTSDGVYKMWLSSSGDDDDVDWYFKSSDRSVYELTMDPVNSPGKKMAFYNATYMGYYGGGAGTASYDIYLLPIGTKYTPVDVTDTDWTGCAIGVTATTDANKLGIKQKDGTVTSPVALSSVSTSHVADFKSSINFTDLTGDTILLQWYEDESIIGGSEVTVPSIITTGTKTTWTALEDSLTTSTTLNDIVVLSKPMTVGETHAKAKKIVMDQSGDNTGKLTIQPSKGLEVASTVKVYSGTNFVATGEADLILESSSSKGNASLIFDNSNACQATVQMYSKAAIVGNTWNWQYVGTPFTGSIPAYNYYGSWMYKWDKTDGWLVVHGGDELTPFAGYCLTQESATTHVMGGTLVATDGNNQTIAMGANTDMVLANSWTAPIWIGGFTVETFTSTPATIYLFNTGSAVDGSSAGTAEAGTYEAIPINSAPFTGDGLIPSMQGFFVTTQPEGGSGKAGTITLKYDELVRPNNDRDGVDPNIITTGPMYAPKRVDKPEVMKIMANGSKYSDRVVLLERADFSSGFDNGWDGEKLSFGVEGPSVYVINGQGKYDAVSAIPSFEGTVVGFRSGTDNSCTISFEYDGNETLYLNDLKMQQSTPIDTVHTYTFSTASSDNEARFIISATPITAVTTGFESSAVSGQSSEVRKVLIGSQIYIIRGGRMYSAEGQMVK